MWTLPSPRTPQGALSGSYASYEARRAECVWREVEVPQILRSLRAIAGKPQNVFSTPEVVVHGSRGASEPCAILGHRFTAGQSLTTICFSLKTTHVVGTGFKTTERLREPSAADEPFRLDDGTELVPHQHCNWGSSVAFDGDR